MKLSRLICSSKVSVTRIMWWDASLRSTKVTAQSSEEFVNHPKLIISHLIDIVFVSIHPIYLKYSGVLSSSHFSTHAISNYLLCSVSHSVNPLLSVSLSPPSTYSPLYLYHLSLFNIKGNQFCWSGIIDKNWFEPMLFLSQRLLTIHFLLTKLKILPWLDKICIKWSNNFSVVPPAFN